MKTYFKIKSKKVDIKKKENKLHLQKPLQLHGVNMKQELHDACSLYHSKSVLGFNKKKSVNQLELKEPS